LEDCEVLFQLIFDRNNTGTRGNALRRSKRGLEGGGGEAGSRERMTHDVFIRRGLLFGSLKIGRCNPEKGRSGRKTRVPVQIDEGPVETNHYADNKN